MPHERPALLLADATGSLRLSNSKENAAILHGAELRPGQEVTGTVTLAAGGADGASLALAASHADEVPGTGGGRLSERLQLAVADVTSPAEPLSVYTGPLATLGQVALGSIAATRPRTFRFTAWLPRGTAADHQGARLSVDFTWSAHAVAFPAVPAPVPSAPAAGGDVRSEPSLRSCKPRRRVVIRPRVPRGLRIRSVRAYVDGRRTRRVKRVNRVNRVNRVKRVNRVNRVKRVRSALELRRLPRRAVRIKVVARLSNGRAVVVKRTHRPCARRQQT